MSAFPTNLRLANESVSARLKYYQSKYHRFKIGRIVNLIIRIKAEIIVKDGTRKLQLL
jgi:hypothetical protein